MVALGGGLLLPLLLIQLVFFPSDFTSASSPAAPSPSTTSVEPSSAASSSSSSSSSMGGPIIIYPSSSSSSGRVDGFKAKLIHRDAFGSPFYNPELSEWDKTQLAIRRSLSYYYSNLDLAAVGGFSVGSRVRNGEFIMYFEVGSPPQSTYAVADTGSHLTWIQCVECDPCLKQQPRLFNNFKSTTFKLIGYYDNRCRWLGDARSYKNICRYEAKYGDDTRSTGYLSEDTFWFNQWEPPGADVSRSLTILRPILFGCGLANSATINKIDGYSPGIVGLNNDKLSLVSQLGMSRFSLCISKKNVSSINFGSFANIASYDEERIPLVGFKIPPNGEISYEDYYVRLVGISLSNDYTYTMLDIPGQFLEPALGGGALIDTGATLTIVPEKVLNILVATFQEDYFYLKTNYSGNLPLCYNGTTYKDLEELSPTITLHFNGSDLSLNLMQMWIPGNPANTSWCLAMHSLQGLFDYFIIGTHILENYNIGFDLDNREVSLIPNYC